MGSLSLFSSLKPLSLQSTECGDVQLDTYSNSALRILLSPLSTITTTIATTTSYTSYTEQEAGVSQF